ncbi:MAG: pyrroline-5-carboxylate reductase [Oscillospiraceae bacterium]|nr:pyrroline-5-carboxylate reductase [Oscillospiraceae bacterium]
MKYGFIGCGNMGGAIARALARVTRDFMLTDRSGKVRSLAQELGGAYGTNAEAAACDRVFLGVKPQMMAGVLGELQPILAEKKPLLITMAAGLEIRKIEEMAGIRLPVIRIMPNTPVSAGKGVILYCRNDLVDDATLSQVLSDLRFAGMLDPLDEKLIDAACAVSGCGPAYVYMFLEAMADGAVACGVPREKALRYAAATLSGAAELALTTGKHPGELKDAVCSPGGSTIAGVKALEEKGFRGAVMDAVAAAYRRNQELGK